MLLSRAVSRQRWWHPAASSSSAVRSAVSSLQSTSPSTSPTTSTTRTLLTAVTEPPLDSTVTERPCTIILTQDAGVYDDSWSHDFTHQLPTQHGMAVAELTLSSTNTTNPNTTMAEALQELSADLTRNTHNTVLVARGPWMAWLAQFYLESLPLAGLVLVDPLPLDDRNSFNQLDMLYRKRNLTETTNYKLYQEYAQHWDHWTLQLEAGSVPMLVLQSIDRPSFKKGAAITAKRHSDADSKAGEVVVQRLDPKKQPNVPQIVSDWINLRVL